MGVWVCGGGGDHDQGRELTFSLFGFSWKAASRMPRLSDIRPWFHCSLAAINQRISAWRRSTQPARQLGSTIQCPVTDVEVSRFQPQHQRTRRG